MLTKSTETPASALTLGQHNHKPWFMRLWSPLWLFLLVALLVRIGLLIHSHGAMDGDEAVVGIQAEHILQGERPIYYYAQSYMGSLEAYLIALVLAITGPSVAALRVVPVLLSLVVVALTWSFATMLAEAARLSSYTKRYFVGVATLVAAILPLYDAILQSRTWGGHIETYVLMLLLLISTFQLMRRWRAGASVREQLLRWSGIGLVVGLGFWVYPLIISAVLTAVLWILGGSLLYFFWTRRATTPTTTQPTLSPLTNLLLAVAALPTALIGFSPALVWGASNQWKNVTYIFQQGSDPSLTHRVTTIAKVTRLYAYCVGPRVIDGAMPFESAASTALHYVLLAFSALVILAALFLLGRSFRGGHPLLTHLRQAAALPLLFGACTVLIFCTSAAAANGLLAPCSHDFVGRYAGPIMLALPFCFALVFASLGAYLYGRRQAQMTLATPPGGSASHKGPNARFVRIAQIALPVLLLAYLGGQLSTYQLSDPNYVFADPYCADAPANSDALTTYLDQQHIHYIWAPNELSNPIMFKTNSRLIFADPVPLMYNIAFINRFPAYTQAVIHANRPAIIVLIPHNDPAPRLLQVLDSQQITYQTAIFPAHPDTDILVVTHLSRTVEPFASKSYFGLFDCRK